MLLKTLWRSLPGCVLLLAALPALAECPRIVSQSPYITRALEWLGRGDCVVGVSRHDTRALPHTGGVHEPDLAAIAALRPDLLIVSKSTADAPLQGLPAGTRVLRVDGFGSLADAEAMLVTLAEASGAADGRARVDEFAWEWRAHAVAVGGRGQRALVLSACSGSPYSFGRGHVVADAFVQAGFDVVETAPRLRHLREGEEIPSVAEAVARLQPEIIFSLSPKNALYCDASLGQLPARLVVLQGENFFNPGPSVVAGLTELMERMKP